MCAYDRCGMCYEGSIERISAKSPGGPLKGIRKRFCQRNPYGGTLVCWYAMRAYAGRWFIGTVMK